MRTAWDDEREEWYFSVTDVVEVLTDSADVKQYIKKMRKRDPELEAKWGTICTPLECRQRMASITTRICNETKALESYREDRKPVFKSSSSQFMTIIYSMEYETVDTSKHTSKDTSRIQVSELVLKLLLVLKGEMSVREMMEKLELKNRSSFLLNYLNPALENGLVIMTQPNSPKSPTQKYYLTEMGKALLNNK